MFRIYANRLTEDEIVALDEIWEGMHKKLMKKAKCRCLCSDCKYSTLCKSIARSQSYIDKVMVEERG